jgi:hypothetical protein
MKTLNKILTLNSRVLNIEKEKTEPVVKKEALAPFNSPLVLRQRKKQNYRRRRRRRRKTTKSVYTFSVLYISLD